MHTYSWPVAALAPLLACSIEAGKEDTHAPSPIVFFHEPYSWILTKLDLIFLSFISISWMDIQKQNQEVFVVLNQNLRH